MRKAYPILTAFSCLICSSFAELPPTGYLGDLQTTVSSGTVSVVSTGTVTLKGYFAKTKVLRADKAIIYKIETARPKMKASRTLAHVKNGPKTLQEAADILGKSVAMACPPGACVEYKGVFYFSGGDSTKLITDFSSGFAISKGSKTIMRWEKDDKRQAKSQPPNAATLTTETKNLDSPIRKGEVP